MQKQQLESNNQRVKFNHVNLNHTHHEDSVTLQIVMASQKAEARVQEK